MSHIHKRAATSMIVRLLVMQTENAAWWMHQDLAL